MTRVVCVEAAGRRAWLYGDGRLLYPAIRAARAWRKFDQRRRAIEIKTADLDNVLAALTLQNGGDVRVERVA